MHFDLVDRVVEASAEGAVTLKAVSLAEEYLQDHFPSYPVLPGVLMLEAMVQAGRVVGKQRGVREPLVLGEVRALKYNRFVPPGSVIRAVVTLGKTGEEGMLDFRGRVELVDPLQPDMVETAASGRFTLRPIRLGSCSAEVGTAGPMA
ncbi:3-hydroxyacyl-[acyl-carrier-protein] dehydratase, FabZ form [hydrothermal vent metagenome]|uniref:3-hydroxyacyl-[acyl-carrier-protein] dehydratase, FabZ form n=1 Tax=hydrothermal vent metagenome TaxID=652676 RepID=A0A3B1DWU0_9ZZZZ